MESTLISDELLGDIRIPIQSVVATASYAHAVDRQSRVCKTSERQVCRTTTEMLAQSHQRLQNESGREYREDNKSVVQVLRFVYHVTIALLDEGNMLK